MGSKFSHKHYRKTGRIKQRQHLAAIRVAAVKARHLARAAAAHNITQADECDPANPVSENLSSTLLRKIRERENAAKNQDADAENQNGMAMAENEDLTQENRSAGIESHCQETTKRNQNPQKLNPLETIYLFQAQHEEIPKGSQTDKVKEEVIEFEIGPSKPTLQLDVEYEEPKSCAILQNLVINRIDPESDTTDKNRSINRSSRLKRKKIEDQKQILQAIKNRKNSQIEEVAQNELVEQSDEDAESNRDSEENLEYIKGYKDSDQTEGQDDKNLDARNEDGTQEVMDDNTVEPEVKQEPLNRLELDQEDVLSFKHETELAVESLEQQFDADQPDVLEHKGTLVFGRSDGYYAREIALETDDNETRADDTHKKIDQQNEGLFMKRGRGRPRKIADDTHKKIDQQNEGLFMKRGRGRPRKINQETHDKLAIQGVDTYQGIEGDQQNELLKKRSRGRPRKISNTEKPVESVKRPRGRPRKNSVVIRPIQREKRKRGRPPKPIDPNAPIKQKRPRKPKSNVQKVDIPIALNVTNDEQFTDHDSDNEYTVYISEEVMEEPIHLEVAGVINFLV